MSVRTKTVITPSDDTNGLDEHTSNLQLGEGASGFAATNPDHPLSRNFVVSIRASLAELQAKSGKAVWSPSQENLKSIFQQRQFVSLKGTSEMQGDLKQVVIHSVTANNVISTFPVAVGTKMTGVDENTFSSQGAGFSMIIPANQVNNNTTTLQKDDVSIAYNFSKQYPGYTAQNLETNGVHAVPSRRFVLVSDDHPLITAIHENAEQLQAADVQQMPEHMVKVAQPLYETLMPLVKEQVRSQIKVCDMSSTSVKIAPAEFSSWDQVAQKLVSEKSAPVIQRRDRSINSVGANSDEIDLVKAEYATKLSDIEASVYHEPREIHMEISACYNFL